MIIQMQDLGYYTDLFLLEEATVSYKVNRIMGKDTVVESPENPTYYFGNFILLEKPPTNEDKDWLEKYFDKEFAHNKDVQHYTFCWRGNPNNDSTEKSLDYSAFTDAGYELEENLVMILHKDELIPPKNTNTNVTIRPFSTDEDWTQWMDVELAERAPGHNEDGYRAYLTKQMKMYQNLNKKNSGSFYGAFLEGELVAYAGLFFKSKIGRFQNVRTKSNFRKQGICNTLLFEMCKQGITHLDGLVICADRYYHAKKIYENLGFKHRETQMSLCWWKKSE